MTSAGDTVSSAGVPFAQGAGFERVCAEGFLTGGAPGANTWGLCVVLRKARP